MESAQFKSSLGTIEINGDIDDVQSIKILQNKIYKESKIPNVLQESVEQVKEYIEKRRTHFTFLMNPKGTEFQLKIWNILQTIPYGKTTSYLKIAKIYGNINAVRAIGAAIGKNPILVAIPCHRVIGSNGSLVGFASGLDKKNGFYKMRALELKKSLIFSNYFIF